MHLKQYVILLDDKSRIALKKSTWPWEEQRLCLSFLLAFFSLTARKQKRFGDTCKLDGSFGSVSARRIASLSAIYYVRRVEIKRRRRPV